MQQLDSNDINTIHARLESEQARLLRVRDSSLTVLALSAGLSIEDQSALLHDQSVAIYSHTTERENLQKVTAALERLGTDAFGVCQECEEAIPKKRLLAIPWADHCVRCEEQLRELTANPSESKLAA